MPAFVQCFGATETTAATTLQATGTTTAGNTLVACISLRGSSPTVSSVTDSAGNTWTAASTGYAAVYSYAIFICPNAAAVTYVKVTANVSSTIVLDVQEFSGLGVSPFVDQVGISKNTSTAPSETTGATTTASEVAVGFIGWATAGTLSGQASGWTTNTSRASSVSGAIMMQQSAYRILSSTGTQTYGGTLSTSESWGAGVVTLNPTVGGGGSGSLSLTGAAQTAGGATGSLSLTGAAQTAGGGSGSLSLTGAAQTAGGGSGSLSLTGAAQTAGGGSGSLSLTGTAQTAGGGTGALSLTGTAQTAGGGTGALSLTGTAQTAGGGTGALALTGASAGGPVLGGSGSGSVSLLGAAAGYGPAKASSPLPTLQYFVAFQDGPGTPPSTITGPASPAGTLGGVGVWTDITQWVMGHSLQRGRQHELTQFNAGTVSITLDNADGRFYPWSQTSPYAGYVNPRVVVQIRATVGGTTFYRFTGYANAWMVDWAGSNADATVTLEASDAFRDFGSANIVYPLTGTYASVVEGDGASDFWRFGDTVGSTSAANSITGQPAATAIGGSTYAFGGPQPLETDETTSVALSTTGTPLPAFQPPATVPCWNANAWTYECWVMVTTLSTDACLYYMNTSTETGAVEIDLYSSQIDVTHKTTSGTVTAVGTFGSTIVDGLWHHIVVACNNNNVQIYKDGTRLVNANISAYPFSAATAVSILSTSAGSPWEGGLADVALYTTQLTAAQVAKHYAAGASGSQQELSGSRINNILNVVDWPTTDRYIDTGVQTIQANTEDLTQTTLLSHAQAVEQTELGAFYMTANGVVRFIASNNLAYPGSAYQVPQATFGDWATSTQYQLAIFGNGKASGYQTNAPPIGAAVAVSTGDVLDLLSYIDNTAGEGASITVSLIDQLGNVLATVGQAPGTSSYLSETGVNYTVAAGVTSVRVQYNTNNAKIGAGQYIRFYGTLLTKNGLIAVIDTDYATPANWGFPASWIIGGPAEIPFQPGPTLGIDDQDIWTEAAVTRAGGTLQVADASATVQAQYGRTTWTPSATVLYIADSYSLALANTIISRYQTPHVRLASISVQLLDVVNVSLAQVQTLLGLELMYAVTVNRHQMANFSQAGVLEGISETVTADSWVLTFALAPY